MRKCKRRRNYAIYIEYDYGGQLKISFDGEERFSHFKRPVHFGAEMWFRQYWNSEQTLPTSQAIAQLNYRQNGAVLASRTCSTNEICGIALARQPYLFFVPLLLFLSFNSTTYSQIHMWWTPPQKPRTSFNIQSYVWHAFVMLCVRRRCHHFPFRRHSYKCANCTTAIITF